MKTPLATVSRNVSELESHLQTKLFNRSSRKLVLTDAGSYVAACKRILADISEAERSASGEYKTPTGELVVTAPIGLGRLHVIPILADFFKAYPQIDVRLILTDRIISLIEEHVDVALRNGELPDSNLIALRVGTVRRVVCASPAYLEARGTPRTPDELAGHDCISYEGFFGPDVGCSCAGRRMWLFRSILGWSWQRRSGLPTPRVPALESRPRSLSTSKRRSIVAPSLHC
jgi:DNA-binding transcriptional LysR family regulator